MNSVTGFAIRSALGAGLVVISTVAAVAATLTPDGSRVLVNSGGGYHAVTATTEVAPGTLILTEEGSAALVSYSPTCSVRIGGAGVWTVFSEPPCASGSQLVDLVPTSAVPAETAGASAGSAATAAIETGAVVPEAAAGAGGLGSSALVVGGLVVAGGGALALASGGGGSSKSKPVSP